MLGSFALFFSSPASAEEEELTNCSVDFSYLSSSGGYYSSNQFPNASAFAALNEDGSITAWGSELTAWGIKYRDGVEVPTDAGHIKIYSNEEAFAALKEDGSITAWGNEDSGGANAPTGVGYITISSSGTAFAALKEDGSITAWGNEDSGGTDAPADTGYTQIYSSYYGFAAMKTDGSITTWGSPKYGLGSWSAPSGTGYTDIYGSHYTFAALHQDGSIATWGRNRGFSSESDDGPTDKGYTKIVSNGHAYAALKKDGSITAWGDGSDGGRGAPPGTGYTKIYATSHSFAALRADGSIDSWGSSLEGGTGAPKDTNYVAITATGSSYAALKEDGSITAWGYETSGGTGAPANKGYTNIYSTKSAFAALKKDGSIVSWGDSGYGGTGAPTDKGYTNIYSNDRAFAALKEDGSVTSWGNDSSDDEVEAPTDNGYVFVNRDCPMPSHQTPRPLSAEEIASDGLSFSADYGTEDEPVIDPGKEKLGQLAIGIFTVLILGSFILFLITKPAIKKWLLPGFVIWAVSALKFTYELLWYIAADFGLELYSSIILSTRTTLYPISTLWFGIYVVIAWLSYKIAFSPNVQSNRWSKLLLRALYGSIIATAVSLLSTLGLYFFYSDIFNSFYFAYQSDDGFFNYAPNGGAHFDLPIAIVAKDTALSFLSGFCVFLLAGILHFRKAIWSKKSPAWQQNFQTVIAGVKAQAVAALLFGAAGTLMTLAESVTSYSSDPYDLLRRLPAFPSAFLSSKAVSLFSGGVTQVYGDVTQAFPLVTESYEFGALEFFFLLSLAIPFININIWAHKRRKHQSPMVEQPWRQAGWFAVGYSGLFTATVVFETNFLLLVNIPLLFVISAVLSYRVFRMP